MSTPITIDNSIEPNVPLQSNSVALSASPTLLTTTNEWIEEFNQLPNHINRIAAPFVIKYSTILCKLDNLKLRINELETHLTQNTAPDFIIKQFKNMLNQENELLIKQSIIKMKMNQLLTLKITQANELITEFKNRTTVFMTRISAVLATITNSSTPRTSIFWIPYLDYFISLKLIEFQDKQELDKEKKAKKQLLFNTKSTTEAIPVVMTQKELKTLNNKIKNLELNQTRTRTNTKKKQANNPTTTSKSNSKPTRKVFPKRKQNKSQSVPPKPKNTRKRT